MSITTKIVLGVLAFVIVGFFGGYFKTDPVVGSVAQSGEYQSTTTGLGSGNATIVVLKSAPGVNVLGSVVITGATAGSFYFYNATTTDNTLRASVSTTSITLVNIPNSAATGTYTFDIVAPLGLLMEITGTAPTSTVTFR